MLRLVYDMIRFLQVWIIVLFIISYDPTSLFIPKTVSMQYNYHTYKTNNLNYLYVWQMYCISDRDRIEKRTCLRDEFFNVSKL